VKLVVVELEHVSSYNYKKDRSTPRKRKDERGSRRDIALALAKTRE